jgi:hypothetical protein
VKPTQDAEPAKGVLDERETETAASPRPAKNAPYFVASGGPERRILAEGLSMGLYWVQGARRRRRGIGADQGDLVRLG